MKWFVCTSEWQGQLIRQLIKSENAQDAENQFRERYPTVSRVQVKDYEWFNHDTQLSFKF